MALIGAVTATLIGWIPNPFAGKPTTGLVVDAADARNLLVEHTEISGSTGLRTAHGPLSTSAVAVTLTNRDDVAAAVIEARITVQEARRLDLCKSVGGDLEVTGTYTFSATADLARGDIRTIPVRFEVPPGRADTLAVTFGLQTPTHHASPLWLYRVKIALRTARSATFLPVEGEFALDVMPGAGSTEPGLLDCRVSVINSFRVAGERVHASVTPSLEKLYAAYRPS